MKHVTREDYPDWVYDGLKKHARSEQELEELLYQWDERVGIMHYEGGVDMETAEREAFQSVLQRLKEGKAELGSLLRRAQAYKMCLFQTFPLKK